MGSLSVFCIRLGAAVSGCFAQSEPQTTPPADAEPIILAPQGEQSERFDIDRYAVEGNTLLSASEVETLLRPFTGKQREYGDVQRALEALEFYYRDKGYSAVQVYVPEQELGTGVVQVKVIEASIRRGRAIPQPQGNATI